MLDSIDSGFRKMQDADPIPVGYVSIYHAPHEAPALDIAVALVYPGQHFYDIG